MTSADGSAPAAIRIVGFDPGLHRTGYACVEFLVGAVEPALVEAGVLRLKSTASLAFRLNQLHDDVCALLDELRPARIVVEGLFVHRDYARTAILMGHARGVVLLAGEARGLGIDEVPPATVKKAITGRGQATKRQVHLAVTSQCGLVLPPSPSDVADAIAIALTGARRLAERW